MHRTRPGFPRPGAAALIALLAVAFSFAAAAARTPRSVLMSASVDGVPSTFDASGVPGSLVYITRGDIWLINDGSLRRLAADGAASSVRWTPGGSYVQIRRGSTSLLMRPDGSTLPDPGGAWAPDDSVVAVANHERVDLMDPQSGRASTLIAGRPGAAFEPVAWSPDGTTVALVRTLTDATELPIAQSVWLVRRDGSDLRQLLPAGATWPRPIGWSPDGNWLAIYEGPAEPCASCRADGQQLELVRADGSRTIAVGTLIRPGWLSWSPDSSYAVAAVGAGRESYRSKLLVRVDLGSAAQANAAGDDATVAIQPAVSPDGARVAFTSAPALPGDAFENLDAAHGYPGVIAQRRIAVVSGGSNDLAYLPVPPGTASEAPVWLTPNLMLYVRWRVAGATLSSQELWLHDATANTDVRVTSDLGDGGSAVGFYGELGWRALFSWHR